MSAESEVRTPARLVRVIELLSRERRPLSVGAIASALEIPTTSAHRLIATLVRLRWIERRDGGLYAPGTALLATAGMALGRSTLLHLARPVLRQVADLSGLQSHVGVLAGRGVTYLARAAGEERRAPEFKLGVSQPIHCTAAGKLLFAFMPGDERQAVLDTLDLRAFTRRTIVDRGRLRSELDAIRSRGYSADRGELNEHWRSVAVPVSGPGREVVAAITCGGSPHKMTDEHRDWIRHEMTALADELSLQLA